MDEKTNRQTGMQDRRKARRLDGWVDGWTQWEEAQPFVPSPVAKSPSQNR